MFHFPPIFLNSLPDFGEFTCFGLPYTCFSFLPYFDHDALMHQTMRILDASVSVCIYISISLSLSLLHVDHYKHLFAHECIQGHMYLIYCLYYEVPEKRETRELP